MKYYSIVGGVNGAGKSSLTGVLKENRTDLGMIIDVDKITAELGGKMVAAGKTAITRIQTCITKGISFTQETTLSGIKTAATCRTAKERGYYIRLFYVAVNTVEESLARIENRVKHGGHNIPVDDVVRRFNSRWEALFKVLPFCDEAEFYDNTNGFQKVAEYRNGEIRIIGNYCPAWLDELLKYGNAQNKITLQ